MLDRLANLGYHYRAICALFLTVAVLNLTSVIAAIIAGFVAVIGYLLNQHSQRVERKADLYAEALRCVRVYQELPYAIWRRDDNDHAEEKELRNRAGMVYNDLQYYLQRLQVESPIVARAYRDLFEQTRRQYRINRQLAWASTMSASGLNPGDDPPFAGDNGPEIDLCIETMRTEVSLSRIFKRGGVRRRLNEQRSRRANEG